MPGSLHTVAFGPPAAELLATLVRAAKGDDVLAPVTVVVPSATAGTTLRRRLGSELGGLLNVAFVSFAQVADRLAGPQGTAVITATIARAHLRAAMRDGTALTPDPAVAASAATEHALMATFAELGPLPEAALDAMVVRDPQAAAVIGLFRRYRRALGPAATGHDVTALAADLLARGEIDPAGLGSLIAHLPRRVRPGDLALLGALAARIPVEAVIGRTGEPEADTVADELTLTLSAALGVPHPSGGPPAEPSLPTRLVRAPDPAEEVAIAVREVVAALTSTDGRPPLRPERIAVLHRTAHPYAAMLHAALADADVPHHVPAVTTLAQSVPGRVLTSLLDVSSRGFRRGDVSGLWRGGPIVDPVTGLSIDAPTWDRLAREAGVGGGLDQWRQRIDRAIATRQEHLARYRPNSHVDAPEPAEAGQAGDRDWRIEGWRLLAEHIEALAMMLTPAPERTWSVWSVWLLDVLHRLVHPSARVRQPEAFERVDRMLAALGELDGIEEPPNLERLRRVLDPELAHPDRSHGRFGHGVFVGRLVDAVGADFDLVVILGAVEGRFPPGRSEDPLLPDRVRTATGGLLGPRGLRRDEEHRDLLAALASAPIRVLATHRSDPREQRERQPAAWFVAACSARFGSTVASAKLAGLRGEEWFVDVPSFEAGPSGPTPATRRELDLGDLLAAHRRLDVDPVAVTSGVVAATDRAFARGLAAASARRSARFDEWSGNVEADEELRIGSDRPRSPTGLERYAQCPFQSFLGDVLRVGAIDDPTDTELISPLDEGSLVHEILEAFVTDSRGKPPGEAWSATERARLDEIADAVAGRYEAEGRTGRPLLWSVRREQLRHQLQRVLDTDQKLRADEGVSPVEVELAFGEEGSRPVTVTLADGRIVAFKGIIDRVDRSVDGRRLVIYDYKTGSPTSFERMKKGIEQGDLTARGTKLQLPIYALAARTRFPDASQVSAYYWFVGRKGQGQTIGGVVDHQAEDRFRDVIGVVVEGLEGGRFPANPGDETWRSGQWTFDHCGWCDYDRICPTSRGETWVRLRSDPELRRYTALAEGPLGGEGDDTPGDDAAGDEEIAS